eukprot:GFYU01030951.1.p1 GENE.GFYU01030951.1~~GFYU01030951.1.p1  ORF type:complete len:328 (-),score=66.53 GFYU01030951.1:330-1313(-)
MYLSDGLMQSFAMGRVHNDNTKPINCMDFSRDGELLVTTSDDESIHVYNCGSGMPTKTVLSRKYGVGGVRFTHHKDAVITASKNDGWDESLRYLSLHDNSYLRYFKGHRDRVVSLAMSPIRDTFMSGSLDGTVRLWDCRVSQATGLLRTDSGRRSCVAYDHEGLVFALTVGTIMEGAGNTVGLIKLFDCKTYDKGPFATFKVTLPTETTEFQCMKFSPDGSRLLVATNENMIFLLDAFNGDTVQVLNTLNTEGTVQEASFSPCSTYVIAGSEDNDIITWRVDTGEEVARLKGHVTTPVLTQFSPRNALIASASENLVFWIPNQPPHM